MISASFHGRRVAAWAVAVALLVPAAANAQVRQALFQPGGQQEMPAQTANHWTSGGSEWTNAYGEPVVVPASYCQGGCPPGGMMGGPGMGACCTGGAGPYPYGAPNGVQMQAPPGGWPGQYSPYAQECECEDPCDRGGLLGRCCFCRWFDAGLMRPVDQCGPHYFDFSAEALFWQRAKTGDPRVDFTTNGVIPPPLAPGEAALSTDNLSFDVEPGIRLTGRYDLGALSLLEVSYSGLFEWSDSAETTAANTLFSGFSAFGTDPVNGIGLTETDAAFLHRIEYWSELHNAEISFRRYWLGFNPRVSGTIMGGFRYTVLNEDFIWHTETNVPAEMDYRVATFNHLVGFQFGGDAWVTVRQGCRVGGYGKAGIYNNHCKQRTNIDGTTTTAFELARGDHVSFIGEGGVSLVCDILPSWSLKAGYDVLFINTVALAPNNVNFDNQIFLGGSRTPVLLEESSVLYHGANLGLEFVW